MLRPGGRFIVTFSDRWFPPKAIRVWTRLHLVLDYFRRRMPQRNRRKCLVRGERYGSLSIRRVREATGLCFDGPFWFFDQAKGNSDTDAGEFPAREAAHSFPAHPPAAELASIELLRVFIGGNIAARP